jgi:hypothetical protein
MNKKTTISNLKVKLNRLNQLEKNETFKYKTLNEYSTFLNETIQRMNLSVSESQLLTPGQSNISSKPSDSERTKINELISLYSEALTEFNPKNDEPIINQFKKTSGGFKLTVVGINLALITGSGILCYNIGKDVGNNNKENLNRESNSKNIKIDELKDSLANYKNNVIQLTDLLKIKKTNDSTKVSK